MGSNIPKSRRISGSTKVAIGISFSRMSGFVRDLVLAYFFGAGGLADVWRVSLKIPNVIQNLLGEGTLSASVIPIYSELVEKNKEKEAGQFIGAVLGILLLVAGLSALIGMLLVPVLLPSIFVSWEPEKISLVSQLVRIFFPMTAILVISAWTLAILNSHKKFFLPYCAPVAWNGSIIIALTIVAWCFGISGEQLLVVAAWGALCGGILQLAIQVPSVFKHLVYFKVSLGKSIFGVQEAITNFIPVAMARGVVNISSLLEVLLAALLAEGAVAALGYAQTIYLLPISIFGLSVAAAELPELSRHRLESPKVIARKLVAALERTLFFVIPSAFVFVCFGDIIIAGIYERGAFRGTDVPVVYAVLVAYSLGLVASSGSRVLSTTFYSLRDTKTPARIAYLRVVLALGIGLLLMFPLDTLESGRLHYGPVGLAIGTSIAAWMEYWNLMQQLKGHLQIDRLRITGVGMMVIGSGVSAVVTYCVQFPINGILSSVQFLGSSEQLFSAILIAGTYVVSYLIAMDWFGIGWSVTNWLASFKNNPPTE